MTVYTDEALTNWYIDEDGVTDLTGAGGTITQIIAGEVTVETAVAQMFGYPLMGFWLPYDGPPPPIPPDPVDDIAWAGTHTVLETASIGTVVGGVLTATGTVPVVFTLSVDAGGKFEVVDDEILVAAELDYETATSHSITVRATNDAGHYDEAFTITVTDVAEAPTDIVWAGTHTVAEDAAVITVVGGSLSSDGTAPITFTMTDTAGGKFDVSGTSVIVTGALDYETATSHSVTIRATNAGGFVDEIFSIAVSDVSDAAGDPNFSDVKLLLGFDGSDGATSSSDLSSSAHTMTFASGAELDTAQSKFGGASLMLDGSTGDVSTPFTSDFIFSGQFTIEGWLRIPADLAADVSYGVLSAYQGSGTRSFRLSLNKFSTPNRTITFGWSSGGTSATHTINSSSLLGLLTDDTWHHVAWDRDSGGTMRLYFNGSMVASVTGATSTNFSTATPLAFGKSGAGTFPFRGHLDEWRITKGLARYASDSGYTVPAAQFPRS